MQVQRLHPALETATVADECPLCVDLDGTLIDSDTLHEAILDGVRQNPLEMVALPLWIFEGRAGFKRRVNEHCEFDASTLPYREDVVAALREAREQGRRLVLATAASAEIASAVAAHLGIFDAVVSSTSTVNLKGAAKRDALDRMFGEGQWDYVGDSGADVPVRAGVDLGRRFAGRTTRSVVRAFWSALRPHQWVKNVLIFLPFLLGHHWSDWRRWMEAVVAFAAFSLVASAGYLVNDLLDRRDDRRHARKKHRPFASGALPLTAGLAAAPVLLAAALGLCALLPVKCAWIVCGYFVATVSYSMALKKTQLVDVLMLACLYSSRLVMGGEATGTAISLWLLRFSLFMFLTLALAKRVAELRMLEQMGASIRDFGRGYRVGDLPILEAMGVGAGYMAALVMVLYIEGSDMARLYPHANYLWMMLPVLLFWISHLWLTAHRGELPDDPILFAFRDRKSLWTGAVAAVCVVAASL